jgi:hypothetical protein
VPALALAGGSYAAGKITGKQIAKNASASQHITTDAIAPADLSAAARGGLQGAAGPQGVQGPQDPAGILDCRSSRGLPQRHHRRRRGGDALRSVSVQGKVLIDWALKTGTNIDGLVARWPNCGENGFGLPDEVGRQCPSRRAEQPADRCGPLSSADQN